MRLDSWLAVWANVPSGENATQCGFGATGSVVVTVFVAVSMIDMEAASWLGTHTSDPAASGVTARA
jgi:hypothetical protein